MLVFPDVRAALDWLTEVFDFTERLRIGEAHRCQLQADVADRCYGMISKSGTNGADIIKNDLPAGGFPQVTLTKGQDFNSARCGTWAKK